MSILYDALKKAEWERESAPRGVPLRRLTPHSGRNRPWTRLVVLTVGIAVTSAIGAWVWLGSGGQATKVLTPEPSVVATAQHMGIATTHGEPRPVQEFPPASPLPQAEPAPTPEVNLSPPSGLQIPAEALFMKARQAADDGRWEEAVPLYQQAISLNPALLEARNNLGHVYVRLNRMTAAIAEFRAVLALAPNYAIARNNLGSAFLLDGQEDLAIQEFLEAVRLDGTYVTPYYNLASVYARRGKTDQAMTFLTKALAMEPAVLSWVQEDAAFAGLRDSAEFQRLRSLRAAQW